MSRFCGVVDGFARGTVAIVISALEGTYFTCRCCHYRYRGCDSEGAISFKNDTCPVSKIRGAFDYREDWVEELKESSAIPHQFL